MLKLTAEEVKAIAENEDYVDVVIDEVYKGSASKTAIIERDGKFYKVEYSEGLDEWAEIISWDQDAPEVQKKETVVVEWKPVN